MIQQIPLAKLRAHPGNPRLAPHQDVVDQIAAQLNGAMDEAHALIVRPNGDGYQVLSGHHRIMAAEKVGLTEVPCHVREMSDEDAYMALALNNAQRELHPLEVGLHALRSKLSQEAYGKALGLSQPSTSIRVHAARVADITRVIDPDRWRQLAEIHAASSWLWRALVAEMLEEDWTVEATRKAIKPFQKITEPPPWADKDAIATALIDREMKPAEIGQMAKYAADAMAKIGKRTYLVPVYQRLLAWALDAEQPARLSEVMTICDGVLSRQWDKQWRIEKAALEIVRTRQQDEEERARIVARRRHNVALSEWIALDQETKNQLLNLGRDLLGGTAPSSETPVFNKQESTDIEWAQMSWNPITGCKHNCPYCYARDMALSARYAKSYPFGFEPMLRPLHLASPHATRVPDEAKNDVRFRNVFTGSMADMWGKWVPAEWIEAVLLEMAEADQWNFLTLTKFPSRMAEFSYSSNVWLGTTVDMQARIPAAEKAFAKVKCSGKKWLSVEPLLEPLRFKRLELFDFIVLGGASPVTAPKPTPAWRPPARWIFDLMEQWKAAKGSLDGFYAKTNLLGSECREGMLSLGSDVLVTQEAAELPEELKYAAMAS